MAPADESSDKLKGMPHWERFAIDVGRTFGVPTVLLLLITYWLLWTVTPPVMTGMATFLETTVRTQGELAKTQADIAESQKKLVVLIEDVSKAAEEIVISENATQKFMEKVGFDHAAMLTKLDTIEQATKPKPKTP